MINWNFPTGIKRQSHLYNFYINIIEISQGFYRNRRECRPPFPALSDGWESGFFLVACTKCRECRLLSRHWKPSGNRLLTVGTEDRDMLALSKTHHKHQEKHVFPTFSQNRREMIALGQIEHWLGFCCLASEKPFPTVFYIFPNSFDRREKGAFCCSVLTCHKRQIYDMKTRFVQWRQICPFSSFNVNMFH